MTIDFDFWSKLYKKMPMNIYVVMGFHALSDCEWPRVSFIHKHEAEKAIEWLYENENDGECDYKIREIKLSRWRG